MWQLLEHRELTDQEIMSESSDQKAPLGTRVAFADGRVFRYAKAGAVALAAGKLVCTPSDGTERENTITAAAAAGAKSFTYTAASTMTKNEYADGLAIAVDGTGQGLQYKIKGNDAITAASTGTIYLYDPIITAWDTTTDIMLVKNLYDSVVITPDAIVLPLGVPPIPVTASYYFWLQTWGIAPVLAADSFGNAVDERFCISNGSGGGFVAPATGPVGGPLVGYHIFDSLDATSGDYHPIFLTLQP